MADTSANAESSVSSRTSTSYDAEAQSAGQQDQEPLISRQSGVGMSTEAELPDKSVLSRLKLDKLYSYASHPLASRICTGTHLHNLKCRYTQAGLGFWHSLHCCSVVLLQHWSFMCQVPGWQGTSF